MKQYLEHLQLIKDKGTKKPAERNGTPTLSYFGHQWRHDLADGFPLLTTKKIPFRWVVVELLWFLRGDTNIKYLLDNGVDIWNGDAYNYYKKKANEAGLVEKDLMKEDEFIKYVKLGWKESAELRSVGYKLGDCGFQYGRVWRDWPDGTKGFNHKEEFFSVDQIAKLLTNLKNKPMSRRQILTSIDPAHDEDLALFWCHALTQFNCRPLTTKERQEWLEGRFITNTQNEEFINNVLDKEGVPKYYLDCQMYQRSADMFLGVPFNIASYALLTHIFAKILNMVPGEMIYSYGDSHIYNNHREQVDLQLSREVRELPEIKLLISKYLTDETGKEVNDINKILMSFTPEDFKVFNYNPHPAIKGDLST